jgi:hypothetical protein
MTGQSIQFQFFRGVFGHRPSREQCAYAADICEALAEDMRLNRIDFCRAQELVLKRATTRQRRVAVYLVSDALCGAKPSITSLRHAARMLRGQFAPLDREQVLSQLIQSITIEDIL